MNMLSEIADNLLLEQDSKLSVIRKAIGERIPITINYTGPAGEVRSGQRIDIEPIILGTNAKSGNLVIWAYVFKGVSKRGLPGWKMFRVDRITSAEFNKNNVRFKLGSLPGYEKGKAPAAMKSLSNVEIFSPYWFEDEERFKEKEKPLPIPGEKPKEIPKVPEPVEPSVPTEPGTRPPIEKPPVAAKDVINKIYTDLTPRIKTIGTQKYITTQDYQRAQKDILASKQQEFKASQRQIGGNVKPGEGTRKRFDIAAKTDMDNFLKQNNIQVSDNPEMLQEAISIKLRFKRLINW